MQSNVSQSQTAHSEENWETKTLKSSNLRTQELHSVHTPPCPAGHFHQCRWAKNKTAKYHSKRSYSFLYWGHWGCLDETVGWWWWWWWWWWCINETCADCHVVLFLFSRPFLEVHLNGRMQAMLVAITVSWQQDSRLAKVKKQHLAPGENGEPLGGDQYPWKALTIKKCFSFWKPKQFLIGFFDAFESCLFFSGFGECTKWWGLHKLARQKSQAAYERLHWKKWPNILMGLPGVISPYF